MYKAGIAITAEVILTALFNCCVQDLRSDIMRDFSVDMSIPTLRLAVKNESILVRWMKLNKMKQSLGTSIRTFLANL